MLGTIFETILDILGYMTARVILPLLSFGKLQVQELGSTENDFNWWGFRRQADGTFLLDSCTAAWVGYFFWIAVLITVVSVLR